MNYTDENSKVIDSWVKEGWEWAKPISHEEYLSAKNGEKSIYLTPTKLVPMEWISNVKNKKILGLASGGGQQMPILSAMGAECTLLDYSSEMLNIDKMVSEREGYNIVIINADMTKTFPFPDNYFDMIVNPVSNIYIQDVYSCFEECFRVLKPGGKLLAGLDNGLNYVFDLKEEKIVGKLPFDSTKNTDQLCDYKIEEDGYQFSHTIEEQIGGQLKAGFSLLDIYEDYNNDGLLSSLNVPFYNATLAVKLKK